MKCIVKGKEPQLFTTWKALCNSGGNPPTYAALSGAAKRAVKDALMAEQGYICCYCERHLTDNDSHIEHFRPQSDAAVHPLNYDNLLCSCQNNPKKGIPRHCGVLKDDWFDETQLISPLDSSCETRFVFTGDGRISPAHTTDRAAEETISRLGLDIPKLTDLRQKVIEPFLEETLTPSEMQRFVDCYLQKDAQGRFGEFWTTIRYLF